MVDLLVVDDQFGIRRVNLLGPLEVLGCSIIIPQCFMSERPPKVSMRVILLHLDDLVEVLEGFLILAHQEETFSSFMHITGLILL